MEKYTLDKSLMTGVGLVDGQHMNLVRLINRLGDALENGGDDELLREAVKELGEYAAYHFNAEEGLMHSRGYPETREHVRLHREFENRLMEFELDVEIGMEDTAMRLYEFLTAWLTDHIRDVDGPMGAFLRERDVHVLQNLS